MSLPSNGPGVQRECFQLCAPEKIVPTLTVTQPAPFHPFFAINSRDMIVRCHSRRIVGAIRWLSGRSRMVSPAYKYRSISSLSLHPPFALIFGLVPISTSFRP